MRSDFWSLPYDAQKAIRLGEHHARVARRCGQTISELEQAIETLRDENAKARALAEAVIDESELPHLRAMARSLLSDQEKTK